MKDNELIRRKNGFIKQEDTLRVWFARLIGEIETCYDEARMRDAKGHIIDALNKLKYGANELNTAYNLKCVGYCMTCVHQHETAAGGRKCELHNMESVEATDYCSRHEPQKLTLCWDCAKSANSGCSWAKGFVPVEGWTAVPRCVKGHVDSFVIRKCPEFEEDEYVKKWRIKNGEEADWDDCCE